MKLSMNIVPSDINEAVAILKALQGFSIAADVDTASAQFESLTETRPDNSEPGEQIKPAELPPAVEAASTLKFEDLTTEDARDSADRLWCAEINTSNKGTKADGTFKRAPKLDDEYFNTVIALLDEEAKFGKEGDTLAVAPEAPAPVPPTPRKGPFYWEHPESDSVGIAETEEELMSILDGDGLAMEIDKETYDARVIEYAPQPEPVSPPPPAPAPAAEERKIVGYIHNKSKVQYVPEQLVGWTAEQIAEHCTPVYDEPVAETEDLTAMHSDNVNRTIALVSTQGLGPWLKPLVEHFTGGTCNAKMIPVERSREYQMALNNIEANLSGCKSGAVKWESVI